MMKFKVMILAAGGNRRFREAGIEVLKPDLTLRSAEGHGTRGMMTMLNWVLSSLPQSDIGPVVVGAHPNLVTEPRMPVVWLSITSTRGQAHTLLHMLRRSSTRDEPVLVLNSDVVVRDACLRHLMGMVRNGADSGILVHETADSLARGYVDKTPYATRFAERDRISPWAMVGAWAFSSSSYLADKIQESMIHMREPRLLHAMNKMLGVHECCIVERRDFVDLSSPNSIEYETWDIIGDEMKL